MALHVDQQPHGELSQARPWPRRVLLGPAGKVLGFHWDFQWCTFIENGVSGSGFSLVTMRAGEDNIVLHCQITPPGSSMRALVGSVRKIPSTQENSAALVLWHASASARGYLQWIAQRHSRTEAWHRANPAGGRNTRFHQVVTLKPPAIGNTRFNDYL